MVDDHRFPYYLRVSAAVLWFMIRQVIRFATNACIPSVALDIIHYVPMVRDCGAFPIRIAGLAFSFIL